MSKRSRFDRLYKESRPAPGKWFRCPGTAGNGGNAVAAVVLNGLAR